MKVSKLMEGFSQDSYWTDGKALQTVQQARKQLLLISKQIHEAFLAARRNKEEVEFWTLMTGEMQGSILGLLNVERAWIDRFGVGRE